MGVLGFLGLRSRRAPKGVLKLSELSADDLRVWAKYQRDLAERMASEEEATAMAFTPSSAEKMDADPRADRYREHLDAPRERQKPRGQGAGHPMDDLRGTVDWQGIVTLGARPTKERRERDGASKSAPSKSAPGVLRQGSMTGTELSSAGGDPANGLANFLAAIAESFMKCDDIPTGSEAAGKKLERAVTARAEHVPFAGGLRRERVSSIMDWSLEATPVEALRHEDDDKWMLLA